MTIRFSFFSLPTLLPFQTLKTFNPPSFPSPSPPHSVCPFLERQMAFLIDKIEFPLYLSRGKTSMRGDKKDPKSFINYVERKIPDFICGCIFLRTPTPVFLILLYLLKLLCGLSSHHEDKGSSRYLTSTCVGYRQRYKVSMCLIRLGRLIYILGRQF